MSGILISSQFAIKMTLLISSTILLLLYLQINNIIVVKTSWRTQNPILLDGITYSATFFVIVLVSWLFNKEMETALKRARISETSLKRQRDLLEIKVEQRTAELKQSQVEKIAQLYRF